MIGQLGHTGSSMIKLVVAAALAFAALTSPGGAAVAHVADDSYVGSPSASIAPAVIAPGGRAIAKFSAGFFAPHEAVQADVSGQRAEDALVFDRETGSPELVSRTDGGMSVVFVAPLTGSGPYVLTFSGLRDFVAVVTVTGNPPGHPPTVPGTPGVPGSPGIPHLLPHGRAGESGGASNSAQTETPGTTTPSGAVPGDDDPAGHPVPSDREGRVRLPGGAPDPPVWPDLAEFPAIFLLLAAIALAACLAIIILLIASRRR